MIQFGIGGRIDEETAYTLYRDAPNKNKEIKALADLLTCTPTDVRNWLTERGVQLKPTKAYKPRAERKAWTAREEKRLMKAFEAGKGKKELSKLFGRTEAAIISKINSLKNK